MTRRPPRTPDPPAPPDEYEPAPEDPVAWQAWHRRWRAEMRSSVRRKIAEWCELYTDCPRKGCRRNRTCLAPLACQVTLEPIEMSEEERAQFDEEYAAFMRAVDERARAAQASAIPPGRKHTPRNPHS